MSGMRLRAIVSFEDADGGVANFTKLGVRDGDFVVFRYDQSCLTEDLALKAGEMLEKQFREVGYQITVLILPDQMSLEALPRERLQQILDSKE